MQGCERFRRHLGKQQDHDGQEHARGEHQPSIVVDTQGNQRHQDGGKDINEIVTQQDEPDEAVLSLQQSLGTQCTGVAAVCKVPQSIPVERHQAGFGAGEKGRKQDE
jgi:hypothetical protein